jgi:RNA polymerase sigma-70 factor (ECF subfamily)
MRADQELIQGVLERREEACEALYALYGEKLRRHLRRRVGDEGMAEDLVQEVFLRLWCRADQWRGEGSLQAWLFRVATNLALNHNRACERRREQRLAQEADEESRTPGWLIDAAALGPDAALEQEERRRLLRGCIETLSEEKREVLRLVYDAEMELRQVAAELEIPEGTVKSRLYHARRALARQWREIQREWEESR